MSNVPGVVVVDYLFVYVGVAPTERFLTLSRLRLMPPSNKHTNSFAAVSPSGVIIWFVWRMCMLIGATFLFLTLSGVDKDNQLLNVAKDLTKFIHSSNDKTFSATVSAIYT